MPTSVFLVALAVAFSGTLAIVASYGDDRPGVYLFKPLTTVLILVGALWLFRPAYPRYQSIVALGLMFSLAGDVFLMLPRDRFVAGLASFLLAHVAYIVAFSSGGRLGPDQLPSLLPFAAVGAGVTLYLWPSLGRLKGAVVAYVLAIACMAWRAAVRAAVPGVTDPSYLTALVGACLFMASDAMLAVDRFRRPFHTAQALVLSTYWAAQLLIAFSVRR